MNSNTNKIAFLDLDGTLTRGQILFDLLLYFYQKGHVGMGLFIRIFAWFIGYKLGLFRGGAEKIYEIGATYFSGRSSEEIEEVVRDFMVYKFPNIVYSGSRDLVGRLKAEGYRIIILSMALDIIVDKAATYFGADGYICTKLEFLENVYTGKINGKVVYGLIKLQLANEYCDVNKIDISDCVAYADDKSDVPLLKSVGHGFIVNPSERTARLADLGGLGIIYTSAK